MRPIDADALLQQTSYFDDYDGFVTEYVLAEDVRKAPTIDAKPVVHGEWTETVISYPCVYNEERTCRLHSTVYEHSWCVEGPCEDQTLSNGDRIRAMSDEELAKVISDGGCPPKISDIVCDTIDDCDTCWRNWLKQPAEVEE